MENTGKIDRKLLNKMAFRALFLQASFNYERMQGGGWTFAIFPGLKRIYGDNVEKLKAACKRNMQFFNAHPFIVTGVMGIVIAMEERGEDPKTIDAVKISMMGPFGGIGDAIFWFTLLPITASIGASLAIQGSILGPILFLVIFNIVHFGVLYGFMYYFYDLGVSAFEKLSSITKQFQHAASMVGLMVIGSLIASYVHLSTPLEFDMGGGEMLNVQTDVLDALMPNLLPALATFFIFYLVRKKHVKVISIIWWIILLCVVGSYLHIL